MIVLTNDEKNEPKGKVDPKDLAGNRSLALTFHTTTSNYTAALLYWASCIRPPIDAEQGPAISARCSELWISVYHVPIVIYDGIGMSHHRL
jgi:hypothetical protein